MICLPLKGPAGQVVEVFKVVEVVEVFKVVDVVEFVC